MYTFKFIIYVSNEISNKMNNKIIGHICLNTLLFTKSYYTANIYYPELCRYFVSTENITINIKYTKAGQ